MRCRLTLKGRSGPTVAVGTALRQEDSGRPPHGSQRALLTHWALASSGGVKPRGWPGCRIRAVRDARETDRRGSRTRFEAGSPRPSSLLRPIQQADWTLPAERRHSGGTALHRSRGAVRGRTPCCASVALRRSTGRNPTLGPEPLGLTWASWACFYFRILVPQLIFPCNLASWTMGPPHVAPMLRWPVQKLHGIPPDVGHPDESCVHRGRGADRREGGPHPRLHEDRERGDF